MARPSQLLLLAAVALILPTTVADHYGSGIGKSTTSASHPIRNFNWMAQHLPVHCQDQFTPCNTTFSCGTSGRAALCTNKECTYSSTLQLAGFGIHMVNTSARPYGSMDNWQVEQHFTRKLQRALPSGGYDAFMDQATVLYAASLDRYQDSFSRARVAYQLRSWKDETGQSWYSLLVQVDDSQLVLELVSGKRPSRATHMVSDELQRLPSSVFKANNVSSVPEELLIVLAISKASSDLLSMERFYIDELMATQNHSIQSADGNVLLRCFALPGATALVRVVQRPPSASHGPFGVAQLEATKHSAHELAHVDSFCGVDKFYDNHFAYDQSISKLDVFKDNFDKNNRSYHIFGDCIPSSKPGPGTNIYVVEPSGDTVQLDGGWSQCPIGGSGDALQNACSQGSCSKYKPSRMCSSELTTVCKRMGLRNASCTDCAYLHWTDLEAAGCSNADIVNFCIE